MFQSRVSVTRMRFKFKFKASSCQCHGVPLPTKTCELRRVDWSVSRRPRRRPGSHIGVNLKFCTARVTVTDMIRGKFLARWLTMIWSPWHILTRMFQIMMTRTCGAFFVRVFNGLLIWWYMLCIIMVYMMRENCGRFRSTCWSTLSQCARAWCPAASPASEAPHRRGTPDVSASGTLVHRETQL